VSTRPDFSLLSVVANLDRHKLATGEALILLCDIAWPGDAAQADQQHLRLARNLDPVQYDAADGLGVQTYSPFSYKMGDLKVATDGSVPDAQLEASNVLLVLQQVIEQYAGVVGSNLDLYVLSTTNPTGEPELALSFTVKQTVCDASLVKFKLGASSPLRRLFPLFYYRPNSCIWRYNSPALQAAAAAAVVAGNTRYRNPGIQCGYQGPMTSCSKTIDGATGCIAHNNLVRIGTFPGIDSNGASVATVA
jgi:phage-related protein